MREFIIYCLYDVENNNIFYVGSTYRPLKEQLKEHFKCKNSVIYRYNPLATRSIIKASIIEYCDCLHDMYDGEYYWTNYYAQFFDLYNIDIGRFHSEITKEKIKQSNMGRIISIDTRIKISNTLKGHKLPREVIEKAATARRGKKHSKEWCQNISKALKGNKYRGENYKHNVRVRLENTGEEFCCVADGAEAYGIPSTHICACCRGKRKSAGKDKYGHKLVWSYINDRSTNQK